VGRLSGSGVVLSTLVFRTADLTDAEALSALVNSAYRGDSSRKGWTTEADLLGGQRTDPDKLREMIGNSDTRIELAMNADGAFVGCVHLRREPGEVCYLGMLTIDPAKQAGGLGKQLLAQAEAVALAWKCETMRMTVIDVRQELLQYYLRRGYHPTGKTEPFPEDDPRFGLPKVRGLRFVEFAKSLTATPRTMAS
jgi:GNAT superfamily N-acetyltransferase